MATDASYRSSQVLGIVNSFLRREALSYRQLDYWQRTATFVPEIGPGYGSGSRRLWSRNDLRIFLAVAQLSELVTSNPGGPGGGIAMTRVAAMVDLLRAHHGAGGVVLRRSGVEWVGAYPPVLDEREPVAFMPVISIEEMDMVVGWSQPDHSTEQETA